MKKLLVILSVLICSTSYGQIVIKTVGGATQTALQDTAAAIRADFPAGGGGVTQATLDDSTAAIRADFPTAIDTIPIQNQLAQLYAGVAANTSNIATNTSNIATNTSNIASNTSAIAGKQATLVSGTNIKTVNSNSLLGSGDLALALGDSTVNALRQNIHTFDAKLNIADTTIPILFIGDSWTASFGFTAPVRVYEQTLYGNGGAGYSSFNTAVTQTLVVSTTGAWVNSNGTYTYGANMYYASSSAAGATRSMTTPCSSFDIHYVASSAGGTFSTSIDGVIIDTVNTNNGGSAAMGFHKINGLARGNHLVLVTIISGTVTLCGINFDNSTGVIVHNLGNSGATAARWLTQTEPIFDSSIAHLCNNSVGLVIITLAVNESGSNTTPATYYANMDSLVRRIKRAVPLVSIIINTPADIDNSAATYTMGQYVAQAMALAKADTLGFINNYKAMGAYSSSNPLGLYSSGNHLSATGYAVIGNNIISYIFQLENIPTTSLIAKSFNNNMFIGTVAPYSALTSAAIDNEYISTSGLPALTTGVGNLAAGYASLISLTTGSNNVGLGWKAGNHITTKSSNTAVGYLSQGSSANGNTNTSVGQSSLSQTTGDGNTAVGNLAGFNNTSGASNTWIGVNAGFTGQSAGVSSSVAIGNGAITTGTDGIAIGHGATASSNKLVLGSSGFIGTVSMFGKVTLAPSAVVGTPFGFLFSQRPSRVAADTLAVSTNVQNDSAYRSKILRTVTTASSASITINADITDMYTVTALAAATTINNPTGTLTDGQEITIRIKDNGTARAITWDTNFRGGTVALPSTTVLSKTMYMKFAYNTADTKWDLLWTQGNL